MEARTWLCAPTTARLPAREGHTMKQVVFASAMLLGAAICSAQGPGDFTPAETNVWGAEYPRLDATGRVEIRIKAPDAAKARVNFWSGPKVDLQKQADGTWTVVTPPLVPGLHYYTVVVDGAEFADPGSQAFLAAAGTPVPWRFPSPVPTTTGSRTCRTDRCARCGTPRSRLGAGGMRLFTCRPAMTPRPERGIRCCTSSTAEARMRPAGSGRGGPTSSSTT